MPKHRSADVTYLRRRNNAIMTAKSPYLLQPRRNYSSRSGQLWLSLILNVEQKYSFYAEHPNTRWWTIEYNVSTFSIFLDPSPYFQQMSANDKPRLLNYISISPTTPFNLIKKFFLKTDTKRHEYYDGQGLTIADVSIVGTLPLKFKVRVKL